MVAKEARMQNARAPGSLPRRSNRRRLNVVVSFSLHRVTPDGQLSVQEFQLPVLWTDGLITSMRRQMKQTDKRQDPRTWYSPFKKRQSVGRPVATALIARRLASQLVGEPIKSDKIPAR